MEEEAELLNEKWSTRQQREVQLPPDGAHDPEEPNEEKNKDAMGVELDETGHGTLKYSSVLVDEYQRPDHEQAQSMSFRPIHNYEHGDVRDASSSFTAHKAPLMRSISCIPAVSITCASDEGGSEMTNSNDPYDQDMDEDQRLRSYSLSNNNNNNNNNSSSSRRSSRQNSPRPSICRCPSPTVPVAHQVPSLSPPMSPTPMLQIPVSPFMMPEDGRPLVLHISRPVSRQGSFKHDSPDSGVWCTNVSSQASPYSLPDRRTWSYLEQDDRSEPQSEPSSRRNSLERQQRDRRPRSPVPPNLGAAVSSRLSSSFTTLNVGYERECPSSRNSVYDYEVPSDGNAMVVQLVLPRTPADPQSPSSPASPGVASNQIPHLALPDPYDSLSLDPQSHNIYTLPSHANNNTTITSLMGKQDGQAFRRLVDEHRPPKSYTESVSCNSNPAPSTEEEKRTIFKKYLTVILSCIYAAFIVMLGLVVYVADMVQAGVTVAEVFNIYLTVAGLLWLIFLHIDIRRYLNAAKKHKSNDYQSSDQDSDSRPPTRPDGENRDYQINISDGNRPPKKSLPLSYCFMTGRHSGSFFLKIGAAAFCFGHLIHEGLLLSRQIVYLTTEEPFRSHCSNLPTLILDVVHPIFSFYQLFMIFKYSNVVINRFREAARFAMMHIIAANLCFWVHTIIRETVESLQHKMHDHDHHPTPAVSDRLTDAVTTLPELAEGLHPNAYRADAIFALFNDSDSDFCISNTVLSAFTLQAAPYLYPFTIEYSLLVVGVWFIIWHNIGQINKCCVHGHHRVSSGVMHSAGLESTDDFTSNLVIHVDCHSANRGLFAGLLVLLATVVSVIIFFVAVMNEEYIQTGIIINNISDVVLLVLMSLSVLFAYRQISKLDVNSHAVTFLDDILLFVALPCFFLYAIFNVVAGMTETCNLLSIISSILSVVQVILQTPFIIDGLRRCSNTQAMRYQKPGREIITFLVVCNLAMWILETFEIKSAEAHYDKVAFYGKFMWTFLSHITLPLTLFYRFHSSVCLVDIWKSAYEPA